MQPDVIAADSCSIVLDASLYIFGVLTSNVHMAWMRTVTGRLKSDYRYSGALVYNTFPWCKPSDEQRVAIEKAAQAVLDARKKYSGLTLAELYGKDMFVYTELVKAHEANDAAVMAAYGFRPGMTEQEIVAELFKLYEKLSARPSR